MLNDTPKWVALYTNPRAEKKTCQNLQELGYESYVPLQRKLHKWSDRWKNVEVPLLTSYIFVKMREKDVIPIRAVKGVHHIISWHGKPAIIPDKQIEAMRRMVDAEANMQVMNDEALKKGAYVRIVEGQFAGLEGTLISDCANGNFGVSISGLNFTLVMQVESSLLQVIPDQTPREKGIFEKSAKCIALILTIFGLSLTSCNKDETSTTTPEAPLPEAYIMDSSHVASSHMKIYNFAYPSTDPYGQPVMLSGTITVHDTVGRRSPAHGLLLYNHYTVYRADQCPSRGELEMQTRIVPSGLITISPDYYGFCITEQHHQAYCISSANAQAGVDALIAAKSLLTQLGYRWDGHLFNAGYSQGGQTAIAVLRLVSQRYPDIRFTYTMAGAGSYDIPETYRRFLDASFTGMPSTVASVLLAYNEYKGLHHTHDQLFIDPLLSHIDDWIYSKRYTRQQIDSLVGSLSLTHFATPTLLDTTTDLTRSFLRAFDEDNLCHGWTPRADERLMLFHGSQDITVPVANTENLYRFLTESGVQNIDLHILDIQATDEIPAHENGALAFAIFGVGHLCEILGIQPWSLF